MMSRAGLLSSGLLALALVGAACGSVAGSAATSAVPGDERPASATGDTVRETDTASDKDPATPPDVDVTRHSVALGDVHFDTFNGRSVPLDESTPELRAALLDVIPPLDDAHYEPSSGGEWLEPDDLVLGYVAGDQAYAYPFKILNFHEIVNDELDGVPVLVSYCPLCRSAIVYDRRVGGELLSFGNTSALYDSDMVMVDRTTGSYWWQVAGEAIVGPLTGTRLEPLPSAVATWSDWAVTHPTTLVLNRDTGFDRPYERDVFSEYPASIDAGRFAFPVGEAAHDARLPASALVVGVGVGDVTRAYVVDRLHGPVNDVIADQPVVLLPTGGGAAAFSSIVDGALLEFEAAPTGFADQQTGSLWTSGGVATAGSLRGTQLEPLPSRTTFWFAMVAAFPEVEIANS